MSSKQEYLDTWNKNYYSEYCLIRVTNKCNETCAHCCFRSGPTETGKLSTETCRRINLWTPKNVCFNIMGGEFSILDNYRDILLALSEDRNKVILTTNGFWARNNKETNKFFDTVALIKQSSCKNISVAVSNDKYHEPLCHKAVDLLTHGCLEADWYAIGGCEIEDITPVGRAFDNNLIPEGPVQCYCGTAPSLIVTEDGMVHKCPFGYFPWKHFSKTTWQDAKEYIWNWRATKLSNGMTCISCMESLKVIQCGVTGLS